jgi:hypothetical protein
VSYFVSKPSGPPKPAILQLVETIDPCATSTAPRLNVACVLRFAAFFAALSILLNELIVHTIRTVCEYTFIYCSWENLMVKTKVCCRCGKEKPLKEFFKRGGNQNGYRYTCKECHVIASNENVPRKEYLKKYNKRKYVQERQLERCLMLNYSLTIEEFCGAREMFNGGCAICGRKLRKRNHGVDHDHKTGLVRGILCYGCNNAVGFLRDDPALLRRAIDYLENPPMTKFLGEARYGIIGAISNKIKIKKKLNPERFKKEKKVAKK